MCKLREEDDGFVLKYAFSPRSDATNVALPCQILECLVVCRGGDSFDAAKLHRSGESATSEKAMSRQTSDFAPRQG